MENRRSIDKDVLKKIGGAGLKFFPAITKNIIPLSEKQKENYKEYLNEIKEHYQEKIEQRTGLDLGHIDIDLFSEMGLNMAYDVMIDDLKSNRKKEPFSNFEIKKFYLTSKLFTALNKYTGAIASSNPRFRKISFNDSFPARGSKETFNFSDKYAMVHELGHFLWESISNKGIEYEMRNERSREYMEWSEGFADYGAFFQFRDFVDLKSGDIPVGKTRINGLKKVHSAVENHGQEAYLEIPNKWKEFEKEITGKNLTK